MARPLRIEYEGASYHVMNRGNARRRVFHRDDGYALFVDKLGRAGETFRVSPRASCLLPNHFRLYLASDPEVPFAADHGQCDARGRRPEPWRSREVAWASFSPVRLSF